ncbi:hypothetical protein FXO38_19237, partial [Capsicum annuum]
MVGLCSNNLGGGERETVKLESELVESSIPLMEYCEADSLPYQKSSSSCGRQDSAATEQSGTTVLDQDRSPIDDSSLCSTSQICPAPLSRQFWKAGNYDEGRATKSTLKKGSSFLHIHPKFLHSNATSHKWAFGAVAELLDNAVDEVAQGNIKSRLEMLESYENAASVGGMAETFPHAIFGQSGRNETG